MKKLYIKKVRDVKSPTRAHKWDAGLDLYLPEDFDKTAADSTAIPLGICISLPKGYMAQVIERSSVAKKGFIFAKAPIDSGYTGEIHAIVELPWTFSKTFKAGDKVAQLVITKIETPKIKEVSELRETERGSNGFGSTDKK